MHNVWFVLTHFMQKDKIDKPTRLHIKLTESLEESLAGLS